MKKTIKLTEDDLQKLVKKILMEGKYDEDEDVVDMSQFREYLPLLQKINNSINMREVITWFNENNIEYRNFNDLQMIIIYIAKNS